MGEEKKEQAPTEAKTEENVEAKTEETKEEKTVENKTEEAPKAPEPFTLFVDLHCVGCAKKIERSLFKIRGVEEVTTDMDKNQVTIKGIVELEAICKRIMKKTKRRAKVLSPSPTNEGEPIPQVVNSQVSELTSVELNVNMHCEACAEQLKRKILQMRGVQKVETELNASKVLVTGTMDAKKLVDYIYRRTKKLAQIITPPEAVPNPEPDPEKKDEENPKEGKAEEKATEKKEEEEAKPTKEGVKENDGGSDGKEEAKKDEGGGGGGGSGESNVGSVYDDEHMKKMMYYYQPLYVYERIPPPQLFSDENPNACCIS